MIKKLLRIFNYSKRKKLTVSIITRDSAERLSTVIAQARSFADEIVVGVDAGSSDATWETACNFADTVYRFTHPDQLAPAHMLALKYCKGDWILRLDDDEYMEVGFDTIVHELLQTPFFTHYYLSRKMVFSLTPPRYIHALPWYPNYVLRLFKNDPELIWKPPKFHSGYFVAGPGAQESRFSILHFEHIQTSPEKRKKKLDMYRQGGGETFVEEYYGEKKGELRSFTTLQNSLPQKPTRQKIDGHIHNLEVTKLPPWGCQFIKIDHSPTALASQKIIIGIWVKNTGKIAWFSQNGTWQMICIGIHLKSIDGKMIDPNFGRIAVKQYVRPNEKIFVTGEITAPQKPGKYRLSWDMYNENECWFQECGHNPVNTTLEID